MEFISDMSMIELAGAAVTAVIALFSLIISPSGHKRANASLVAILGASLTLLVVVRYEVLPEIEKQTAIAKSARDVERIEKIMRLSSDALEEVRSTEIGLMNDMLDQRFNELEEHLQLFAKGQFGGSFSEVPDIALNLIKRPKQKFFATSYISAEQWWTTAWGRVYQQENFNLLNQGITIKRVWIYEDNEQLQSILPYINEQHQAGIQIRLVKASDLDRRLTHDIALIDDNLAVQLALTPDQGLDAITFFTEPRDIASIRDSLQRIWDFALEFDPNNDYASLN